MIQHAKDIQEKPASSMLETLGIVEIPVDPFEVARMLEVDVIERLDLKNIKNSGSITRIGEKISIWLNPLDPPNRKKFTLAHELGHLVNDILPNEVAEFTDTPETLYRSGDSAPKEVAANKFAAELLMPEEQVFNVGERILTGNDDPDLPVSRFVEMMANEFAVSKAAMLVRLKVLDIIDQGFEL